MAAPNDRLKLERRRRGWTQQNVADEMFKAASKHGLLVPTGLSGFYVSRWERGVVQPDYHSAHLLCLAFGLPPDRLGLPGDPSSAGPRHQPAQAPTSLPAVTTRDGTLLPSAVFQHPFELGTLELVRHFSMTEADTDSLDAMEAAVSRLCRAYSTTPPAQLLPRVQFRLTHINQLLTRRLSLSQTTRLSVAAGWLYLLLAALHFDLGQREAAEISRDLALRVGQEAHDSNIVAWSYETVSWFAFFEGRPADSLHYAQQGQRVAAPSSSGRVMNTMKVAMATARMGDREGTERAIEQAAREVAELPRPDEPDHHFVFDPPKMDYYAATAYTWLKDAESVRRHASAVVRESGNPAWNTWVPTRVSMAQLDLATALVGTGELDEASDVGARAFTRFVRFDTLLRAAELYREIERRYPNSTEARDFHEQLLVARKGLLMPANEDAESTEEGESTRDQ